jgi:hypothetical protein
MKTAKDYIEQFNREIDEACARLQCQLEDILHFDYSGNRRLLRYAYHKDEEEGFIERIFYAFRDLTKDKKFDLADSDEPLISVLKYWTNDRACLPLEWVEILITRVLEDKWHQ